MTRAGGRGVRSGDVFSSVIFTAIKLQTERWKELTFGSGWKATR